MMKVLYIGSPQRFTVDTEEKYAEWLSSLEENDLVAYQEFRTGYDGLIGLGIEHWQFTRAAIKDSFLIRYDGEKLSLNRKKGYSSYKGTDSLVGNIFPSRIVPLSQSLGLTSPGEKIVGNYPIYEPMFVNQTRHVYFLSHGKLWEKGRVFIKKDYPLYYSVNCNGGILIHCFSEDPNPKQLDYATFLYSQDLRS